MTQSKDIISNLRNRSTLTVSVIALWAGAIHTCQAQQTGVAGAATAATVADTAAAATIAATGTAATIAATAAAANVAAAVATAADANVATAVSAREGSVTVGYYDSKTDIFVVPDITDADVAKAKVVVTSEDTGAVEIGTSVSASQNPLVFLGAEALAYSVSGLGVTADGEGPGWTAPDSFSGGETWHSGNSLPRPSGDTSSDESSRSSP